MISACLKIVCSGEKFQGKLLRGAQGLHLRLTSLTTFLAMKERSVFSGNSNFGFPSNMISELGRHTIEKKSSLTHCLSNVSSSL